MSKPPEEFISNLRETVCTSRENLSHLEQLQEQVLAHPQKNGACTAAWLPPEDGADMPELLLAAKIHKVESHAGTPDIVSRFKETWAGRFYIDHLKQIPLIRRLIIALWRNLYFFYAHLATTNFNSRPANRWRPLVKLADYVESSNIPIIKVFDAVRVNTPVPKVFPAEDQAYLVSPHDHYVFPSIYVAQLSDTEVYGGTNLVFVHDAVICHDLYDFERDYTSEELHGRHIIDPKKKRIKVLSNDTAPEQMHEVAAFLDACASNYAHWLTEVLPRVAVFCSIEQYANVPIIVNDGLHRNIMESLALVVGTERQIITAPVGRAISVGILYVTSVTGYVPFERRDTKLTGHSHGLFSSLALDLVKKRVLPIAKKLPSQDWPRKIYLRRSSGVRKVTNGAELEEILLSNGYIVVETEKLTFVQQLALFNNVEDIIGPSGAALANQIFAPPEAKVHILIGKYDATSYWYWQNMACASGKQVLYSLGKLCDSQSTIHSDFAIDLKVFHYES